VGKTVRAIKNGLFSLWNRTNAYSKQEQAQDNIEQDLGVSFGGLL
jgi:hypothetical protein